MIESADEGADGHGPKVPVLLVEDDPDHAVLIELALAADNFPRLKVFVVHDGQEALDFLALAANNGSGEEYPLPALILLDLNLPKVNGFEVLQRVKADPRLRHIPVSVLTTSANEADVQRAYSCGANCYLSKPSRYTEMVVKLHRLTSYMLTVNQPACAS